MKTFKKILVTIINLLCCLSINAATYDFEVGGIYYNIISETDQTVEVTKNGTYSGDIEIPDNIVYNNKTFKVTEIAGYAFSSSSITSISIGNNIKGINLHAFSYCSNLTSITIPNSVTSIGIYAFYGCI